MNRGYIRAFLSGFAYVIIVYGAMVAAFHLWAWLGQPQPTSKADLGGVSKVEEEAST